MELTNESTDVEGGLEYYGHGSGLFVDLRSMSWIYIDSKQHPDQWIEAQGNMEGGGDIHMVEGGEVATRYPDSVPAAQAAMEHPGTWWGIQDGKVVQDG